MDMKRLAAAATAAVFAAAVSVSAFAQTDETDGGELRLLTEPISTVDGAEDFSGHLVIGDTRTPLFIEGDDGCTGIFDITESDLEQWRSTGEFTYTEVNADFVDLTQATITYSISGFSMTVDNVLDIAYSYDGNGNLTKLSDSIIGLYATDDGYIVTDTDLDNKDFVDVTIEAPTSESFTHTFDTTVGYQSYTTVGKYIDFVLNISDTVLDEDFVTEKVNNYVFTFSGLTRDGTVDEIFSGMANGVDLVSGEPDFLLMYTKNLPSELNYYIYLVDTDELVQLIGDSLEFSMNTIMYDDTIVTSSTDYSTYKLYKMGDIEEYGMPDSASQPDGYCVLEEVAEYAYIGEYYDGLYLIETFGGEWGYIDSDGNLLALYDDAGSFMNDYAPVVENGRVYLINKSFERVSEEIDGEAVGSYEGGLYRVTTDGVTYFMTYAEGSADEASASDAADSDTSNPNTGAAIAFSAAAVVIVGGVIAIAARKRR